jgi:hypothetical protein
LLFESPYLFVEQLLCPAFELGWFHIGLGQKSGHELSHVNDVQLGVGAISQIDGRGGGQSGLPRTVGG